MTPLFRLEKISKRLEGFKTAQPEAGSAAENPSNANALRNVASIKERIQKVLSTSTKPAETQPSPQPVAGRKRKSSGMLTESSPKRRNSAQQHLITELENFIKEDEASASPAAFMRLSDNLDNSVLLNIPLNVSDITSNELDDLDGEHSVLAFIGIN